MKGEKRKGLNQECFKSKFEKNASWTQDSPNTTSKLRDIFLR